jgi:hypothetical protein
MLFDSVMTSTNFNVKLFAVNKQTADFLPTSSIVIETANCCLLRASLHEANEKTENFVTKSATVGGRKKLSGRDFMSSWVGENDNAVRHPVVPLMSPL